MRFFRTKRYLDDEGGAISAFVLVMFLTMIVGGGMGIDFMYHESERAELQDALDRGVLASASFDISDYEGTTEDDRNAFLKARVESYLRSNGLMARRSPNINVVVDVSELSRRISVTGTYEIDTFFLKLAGIDSLTVSGASTAQISRGRVEISLILDNSGSMAGAKMDSLIVAANNFVDLMLTENTIADTTISLIPFTAGVNLGADFASYYNLNEWQDYSYCFEFEDEQFNTTEILPITLYQQEQHYFRGNRGTHECPPATVMPFSNDPVALKAAISDMEAGGYTSTWAGMKWGAALLDPGTQPVVTSLIANNQADPGLAGRPVAWNDEFSAKFIILMTDGANTTHRVMRTNTDNYNQEETDPWRSQANADFWDNRNPGGFDLDWARTIFGGEGDDRLIDICNAAKAPIPGSNPPRQRITVFTIGFAVSEGSNPYIRMRDCASSLNRFYHVTDADLSSAFTQIGSSINKLRLVD